MQLLATLMLLAQVVGGGKGMLYGEDQAFTITAAPGWVVDTASGVPDGVPVVFYPKNSTWRDSDVMAYPQAVSKRRNQTTIEDVIRSDAEQAEARTGAKLKATRVKTIPIAGGREARIYRFSGD